MGHRTNDRERRSSFIQGELRGELSDSDECLLLNFETLVNELFQRRPFYGSKLDLELRISGTSNDR